VLRDKRGRVPSGTRTGVGDYGKKFGKKVPSAVVGRRVMRLMRLGVPADRWIDGSMDRSIDRAPFYEMSGPSPETTELPRADKEHEHGKLHPSGRVQASWRKNDFIGWKERTQAGANEVIYRCDITKEVYVHRTSILSLIYC